MVQILLWPVLSEGAGFRACRKLPLLKTGEACKYSRARYLRVRWITSLSLQDLLTDTAEQHMLVLT